MRKKNFVRLVLIGACCLMAAFPALGSKKGLQSAKDKKTTIEQEKKKAEAELKKLEALKGDAAAYVKQLDNSLNALNDELVQLGTDIENKEKEIEKTGIELQEAQGVEDRQYEAMKLRIKYMYEAGDSSYIDLLMEAGSLAELLNRTEYISQISLYDREKLDEYIDVKTQIAATEAKLEEEKAGLLELQDQTEAKQVSMEYMLAEKQKELKAVESQVAEAEDKVSEYEADLKAQENAIKAIEAEIKRQEEEARKKAQAAGQTYKTTSIGDIKFVWPCPSSSRVTSNFGSREQPTAGASTNHKGIDIGAAMGSDIVASAAGTVVVSTYSYSAGNYIMINHGGGVYSVYMHASKLLAGVGETVKQGQVIAKVGSTGYSTGPHLHFGIRVNGTYVNPRNHVSP